MPFVPRTHKARGAEGTKKNIDKQRIVERILYELMMDAIEEHRQIFGELTTSDYQGVMEAKAANSACQILAL